MSCGLAAILDFLATQQGIYELQMFPRTTRFLCVFMRSILVELRKFVVDPLPMCGLITSGEVQNVREGGGVRHKGQEVLRVEDQV